MTRSGMGNFNPWLFLGLIVFLSGCGPYRLGTTLPPELKTVYIPAFKNSTNEPGVEVDITDAVIDRFRIDGNLQPVSQEEADTVLEGEIAGWYRRVMAYTGDKADTVDEYRLYITVYITFKSLRTSEVIMPRTKVTGKTDFFVEWSLTDSEDEARPLAYKDLARRVVDAVVAFW